VRYTGLLRASTINTNWSPRRPARIPNGRAVQAPPGLDPQRVYASFEDMARAERRRPDPIDVVAIVTPNHLHAPVAEVFLQAGFHVICDKPLTTTLARALALRDLAESSGRVFCVTHNYAGYPLVRHARAMVAADALGSIRLVQVEYPQEWLTEPLEQQGHKQAEWRTDPAAQEPAVAWATSVPMPTTWRNT
jgi:predicted dehydrogenase